MEVATNLNFYVLFTMLITASCVAIVTKWIRLPYAIALVIVGLLIGVFHWLPVVTMTPELIMLIFLPAMLFEASWNLHFSVLKSCYKPVSLLATVGVIASTAIVGFILHTLSGIDLKIAFLFGAMISATDPISVLALFKKLRVDRNLYTILEGESLFNDGTAVVLFRILLASIVAGGDLSWTKLSVDFIAIICGGAAVGAFFGLAASKLTQFFDDHLLEITLTFLVAYGSYIVAEQLHCSPVISVLVAGIIMGNYGSRQGMSATTRLAVNSFWEYAAFIAESLVFLLIGMQIKFDLIMKYLPYIGYGILAILIARLFVVYGLMAIVNTKKEPIPLAWRHLLFWGGLRGSLCMAMALSLPKNFPERELIVVTTFGVALFTLLVPGLTMELLVKVMKVAVKPGSFGRLHERLSELNTETAVLDRSLKEGKINKKVYREKLENLHARKIETEHLVELAYSEQGSENAVEKLQVEQELIRAQKERLRQLHQEGKISAEVIEDFKQQIDVRYLEIKDEVKKHD